ncbi:MAG TPA: outer membrane protein assembly factor BamE [Burkholderiales bacterium]
MTTHRPPQLARDPSITQSPRRAWSLRAIVVIALLTAGCEGASPIRPYKMDIQQGNVVTPEMIARLQPGMTRAQVRFTLGTPLVVDPFRADRWDYVYLFSRRGVVTEQRRIVVVFKDEKLVRVEGDVVPAGDGRAGWDARPPATSGAHAAQQTER